ncbi:response regulator transcription factor [Nocardia sp. CA-151230]|uniref:response regulator transcription factor n=1 Tax=Nocardia sp. CA-151230 TaxID=3239982 RepID=UPI003D8A9ED2
MTAVCSQCWCPATSGLALRLRTVAAPNRRGPLRRPRVEPDAGASTNRRLDATRATRCRSQPACRRSAEGLTNKQISARLVISPHTAGAHVEHILTKLGFTSRGPDRAPTIADSEHRGSPSAATQTNTIDACENAICRCCSGRV